MKNFILFNSYFLGVWLFLSLFISLILWAGSDLSYGKIFFSLYFSPIIVYLVVKVFIASVSTLLDFLKQKLNKSKGKNEEIIFTK